MKENDLALGLELRERGEGQSETKDTAWAQTSQGRAWCS